MVLGFNLFAGGGKNDKASESPTASKVTKKEGGLVDLPGWYGQRLQSDSIFILTIPLDAMPL